MRKRLAAVLALAALAGGAATVPAGAAPAAAPPHASRAAVAAAFPGGYQRGIVLTNIYRPPASMAEDFARMRLDGVNTVCIYIYLSSQTPTSSEVTSDPVATASDQQLTLVADLAHAAGLATTFQVIDSTPAGDVWRGEFKPKDVNAWFASWDHWVLHYADLAKAVGATVLYVGSEQLYLAQHYDRQWRRVIADARRHYSGLLSYMTTAMDIPKVPFWDALDFISVSPYYPLSDKMRPSYAEMLHAWRTVHLPYLARLERHYRMPIVFGEVGYRSIAGAAIHPYDGKRTGAPDMSLQADAYAALLDAVKPVPWIKGVNWFVWNLPAVPELDMTFSPENKWAECVVAQHWSDAPVSDLVGALNCRPGIG